MHLKVWDTELYVPGVSWVKSEMQTADFLFEDKQRETQKNAVGGTLYSLSLKEKADIRWAISLPSGTKTLH